MLDNSWAVGRIFVREAFPVRIQKTNLRFFNLGIFTKRINSFKRSKLGFEVLLKSSLKLCCCYFVCICVRRGVPGSKLLSALPFP